MSKSFDILIFGAHPDDAEMDMGGTMLKFVEGGYSIKYICLTRGEMGTYGDADSRTLEFKRACAIAGCEGELLDFKDTEVENTPAARIRLARIIRELRPKLVFAPYHTNPLGELGGLANVDHYACGSLIRDAVKMARLDKTVPDMPKHTVQKLYFYMVPRDVQPTLYVDVSDMIERAWKLIEAYQSQMKIELKGQGVKHILMTRRASYGLELGVQYAERFVTDQGLSFSAQSFFEV